MALDSNRTISVAIEIVMTRLAVSLDDAKAILVRSSQETHRTLRDVSAEVVWTGDLSSRHAHASDQDEKKHRGLRRRVHQSRSSADRGE